MNKKPKKIIKPNGVIEYRLNGRLHREDGPAVINPNNKLIGWYFNNRLHREDGPAIIWPDNYIAWYMNGKPHRSDGPAIIESNILPGDFSIMWFAHGKEYSEEDYIKYLLEHNLTKEISLKNSISSEGVIEYRFNGKLHREDSPAKTWPDGSMEWWINGKHHREDGPAYTSPDGYKAWYINGECHREDGPAVIRPNCSIAWWLNNIYYSEEEYIEYLLESYSKKISFKDLLDLGSL